jgi:hypothetical protein
LDGPSILKVGFIQIRGAIFGKSYNSKAAVKQVSLKRGKELVTRFDYEVQFIHYN